MKKIVLVILVCVFQSSLKSEEYKALDVSYKNSGHTICFYVTNLLNEKVFLPSLFLFPEFIEPGCIDYYCSIIDGLECNDTISYSFKGITYLKAGDTIELQTDLPENVEKLSLQIDYLYKKDLPWWFNFRIDGFLSLKRFDLIAAKRNIFKKTFIIDE